MLLFVVLELGVFVGAARFGPKGCVTLSTSASGTCVIATDCAGEDLSRIEFAFDCEAPQGGSWVRHSFGQGGFDAQEEFDTEVSCRMCSEPSGPSKEHEAEVPGAIMAIASDSRAVARRASGRATTQSKAKLGSKRIWPWAKKESDVYYGPNDCVSTYKSEEGHCIMETACTKEDVDGYEFGLVCVSKEGVPVRHLFGTDSFDPVETFDTLITCEQCLGLTNIPRELMQNGQIHVLSTKVHTLEAKVANLTDKMDQLLPAAPSSAPSPSPAPASSITAQPMQLTLDHRRTLRGSHRHMHQHVLRHRRVERRAVHRSDAARNENLPMSQAVNHLNDDDSREDDADLDGADGQQNMPYEDENRGNAGGSPAEPDDDSLEPPEGDAENDPEDNQASAS